MMRTALRVLVRTIGGIGPHRESGRRVGEEIMGVYQGKWAPHHKPYTNDRYI
jgi:hypothetical protein